MQQFETIAAENPWLALALAFAGGVLAGFTPCTYPVLPVIAAFTGARARGSRWRGFALSGLYVVGLAVVYAALAVVAALSGRFFGTVLDGFWTYLVVGNLCIFFGLVMLEVIPLRAPAFLARVRVGAVPGHDFATSLLMGGASALFVGSCTTPILGALLGIVAMRGQALYGAAMLFLFALGMGSLIIVVGTFAGVLAALPRSGVWLLRVQKASAVLLILAGEYFLIKTGGFVA